MISSITHILESLSNVTAYLCRRVMLHISAVRPNVFISSDTTRQDIFLGGLMILASKGQSMDPVLR